MKRILLICTVALLVAGCSTLDQEFVSAVDRTWETIGPEYRSYVAQDAALTPDTRALRLRTADTFDVLLKEAKLGAGELGGAQ